MVHDGAWLLCWWLTIPNSGTLMMLIVNDTDTDPYHGARSPLGWVRSYDTSQYGMKVSWYNLRGDHLYFEGWCLRQVWVVKILGSWFSNWNFWAGCLSDLFGGMILAAWHLIVSIDVHPGSDQSAKSQVRFFRLQGSMYQAGSRCIQILINEIYWAKKRQHYATLTNEL